MASMGHVPEHVPDVWHGGRTLAVRSWRRFATGLAGVLLAAALALGEAAGQPGGLFLEGASATATMVPWSPARCGRWYRPTASGQPVPGSTPSARSIRTAPAAGRADPSPAAGGRPPADRIRARVPASAPVNCRRRCCARGVVRLPDPITLLGWLHLLDLIAEVRGVLPAACSLAFPPRCRSPWPALVRRWAGRGRCGRICWAASPHAADKRYHPPRWPARHPAHAKDPPVKARLARVLQRPPHAADPRSDRREVPRLPAGHRVRRHPHQERIELDRQGEAAQRRQRAPNPHAHHRQPVAGAVRASLLEHETFRARDGLGQRHPPAAPAALTPHRQVLRPVERHVGVHRGQRGVCAIGAVEARARHAARTPAVSHRHPGQQARHLVVGPEDPHPHPRGAARRRSPPRAGWASR